MANLQVTQGAHRGRYYGLGNRPLTGGRDPARDIQLIDPKISNKHFQIRRRDEQYVIVDLHSRNGVFVNGVKVEEHVLEDGDEIRLGDTRLLFRLADDPDRSNALDLRKDASPMMRDTPTVRGPSREPPPAPGVGA